MSKELAELKIDFIKLLVEIQAHNNRATIIFSLPIPRPRDLPQSWPTQETLNKWMIKHQRGGNHKAWRTYMTFLNKRTIILNPPTIKTPRHYGRDGLHLSELGTEAMKQQIKMAIALIN